VVHDAAHEFLTVRIGYHPIKKIAFDSAANPSRSGHLALDVPQLLGKIPLGFENGPADQRVETAAHHGDPALEIEGRKLRAKFADQQLTEIGLDLIMAGFSSEMTQKINRGLASHRVILAGALQWDNPEAQAMQRFLQADPRGKKTTPVVPSPFSVKAKLANCCSKFAGVSVTAPASARGGGVTAHACFTASTTMSVAKAQR
jgi:hypothetical protein